MNITLDLLSDSSERIHYNCAELPISIQKSPLSNFLNSAVANHWHDDIELCMIISGKMSYNINGTIHTIEEGDGAFINFRQFHGNFSIDESDCEYISVVFHPVLLCTNQFLESTYVNPLISNNAFPYAILHHDNQWQSEILDKIKQMYHLFIQNDKASELFIMSLCFHIWSILYASMPDVAQPPTQSLNRLSALREMTGFLQKHYSEKITLSDIAAAGNVCQSTCCDIFNDYLHQTPIQHLISYRLNKSIELLKNTSMNITEIAMASGFSGVSYFAETFRKYFDCSPTQYRKQSDL